MSKIISEIESQNMKKSLPVVKPGDQVKIVSKIFEGNKERHQTFQGIVIKRGGTANKKFITVRKIVAGVGVEKTFIIHSPNVTKIEIVNKGVLQKSKLYYLRDRIGKKATKTKMAEDQ